MRFIRENMTLTFGLGLPLLMVAFFGVAAKLQDMNAVAPRYSVVYAINYYNGNALHFEVRDRKLRLTYHGNRVYNTAQPELYLYDPTTGTSRSLPYSLPEELSNGAADADKHPPKITSVMAPELEALTLDPSPTAPDGYSFSPDDSYPRGMFEFLIGSRNGRGAELRKGSYRIRVPQTSQFYNAPTFIGWVVPK